MAVLGHHSSSQLAVGIRPLDCKYISEMLIELTTCTGRGGGGSVEKEGTGVKWESHYCLRGFLASQG